MNRLLVPLAAGLLAATGLRAQEIPGRAPIMFTGVPLLDDARRAQRAFEEFRHEHLPNFPGGGRGGPNNCDEQVGRFCYWYDESAPPPPPEPASIRAERLRMLALFDTVTTQYPQDDWTAGQRVRYWQEEGNPKAEVLAALACRGERWWCSALAGFAYHDARDFVRADSAYTASLAQMSPKQRCDWSDLGILLDDYTNRTYRRFECGTPERADYEKRLWWLAKPLYSQPGLDTRSEFLARMTMTRMLEDAPSAYQFGFDADERELLLRYGWDRAWALGPRDQATGVRGVIGYELEPAYQFLPPALLATNPAISDSVDWENGRPPIHARYAPMYARRMKALPHQSALFRRGDSSLVVVAWDATSVPLGKGNVRRQMSVTLARGDSLQPVTAKRDDAPLTGVMTAMGPWGQLIMSAEMTAAGVDTALRARYGMRPPYAIGARVTLSDMLYFGEYNGLPSNLDETLPHVLSTIRVRADQKLGVYFETYGTNPAGEKLKVTLTIAREEDEPGFVRRRLQAMKLSREAMPVSTTIEDLSARGASMTPRAAYLDIRTLKKGNYIVQLEVDVAGQYTVRSERALEITG